jgi:hypothetical protein
MRQLLHDGFSVDRQIDDVGRDWPTKIDTPVFLRARCPTPSDSVSLAPMGKSPVEWIFVVGPPPDWF